MIGKRIFAVGNYNKQDHLLKVTYVKDLEILPNTPIPIPTVIPTKTPDVAETQKPDTMNTSTDGGILN